MDIGIKSIASYIPDNYIDNIKKSAEFGENEHFIEKKIGALKLPRKGTQETSDLCVKAVKNLENQNQNQNFDISNVELLIIITQNGDLEGLPHTSAIVHNKLGLQKTVAAYDISLGCSGYVYGLYAAIGMMQVSGLKNALLVTADPYSKIIDTADKSTSLLFGDAATATWLGENPVYTPGKVLYGTDGEGAEHLETRDGKLHMNGRQVFNFAAINVPPHIKEVIHLNGLTEKDIDAYLIHQGSLAIVDAIARRFENKEKFIKDIAETGNTVSSSIPLLLEKYAMDSEQSLNRVLISGFGVGFSWASALLQRA